MSDILPTGPSRGQFEILKKDFDRGSKVIKEATEEYLNTTEEHKKAQLQKSMSEALDAMNEILNDVLHEKSVKYEKQLSDDYKNFIQASNTENLEKLQKDIDKIKRKL
jgi:hypothetical protein